MTKYKCAVIGCGSVGALKDDKFDRPGGDAILTHCHAYTEHPQTELVAVCDVDFDKAKQASTKWNCPFYADSRDIPLLLTQEQPDIISICTPDETHLDALLEVCNIKYEPKLIIMEKPLGTGLEQVENIVLHCKEMGVPLLINYTRRFDSVHQQVKRELEGKEIYHARFVYGRGLVRDGCHAVDLARYWFGDLEFEEPKTVDYHPVIGRGKDSIGECPHFTMVANLPNCSTWVPIDFRWADSRKYSVFEYDIWYEGGRIRFARNGTIMQRFPIKPEGEYGDYPALHEPELVTDYEPRTELHRCLYNLVDNAVQHLENGRELLCVGSDAIATWEIMEELL